VSDLEVRLVELGGALDHPDGDDLVARVRDEISGRPPARVRRWPARLAAAAAVVTLASVAALPSSRNAIADFFRVDGVQLRSARDRPSTSTSLPPPTPATPITVADAQRLVDFTIVVPDTGARPTVTLDLAVPGGLVTLDYPEYRITEFSAPPGEAPLAKFVDRRTKVTPTTVRDKPGYWITGTHHELAFLDRDNQVRSSTVRTTGHVLLWNERDVTIRIEGPHTLGAARAVADAIS
jgi:hypothetical protein